MFSVFRTPTLVNRNNIQQENNVSARKPGQISARKPFTERSNIDIKENNTPIVKPQTFIKPIAPNEPEIEMSLYVMSFKDTKDTYNDLYNDKYFLNKNGFNNIYKCFLGDFEEKAPIFDEDLVDVIPIEIKRTPDKKSFNFDDVCDVLNNDFSNTNFDDVPFPDLDFNF